MNKKLKIFVIFIFCIGMLIFKVYTFKVSNTFKIDLEHKYINNVTKIDDSNLNNNSNVYTNAINDSISSNFTLNIKQSIEKKQDYYKKGEKVLFKIEVTNLENFQVKNIVLNLNESGVEFLPGDNYTLKNKKEIKVNELEANKTFVVYAIYEVKSNDIKNITSKVSITKAETANNLVFNKLDNTVSTLDFKVGCAILKIVNKEEATQAKNAVFGLYKDSACEDLISAGLVFENLEVNSIYYLKEITPPDNCVLYKGILAVQVDNEGKIQLKKYVADQNIQYRAINSSNEVPTINGDGTAILTLSRTAINFLPNLRGQSNLYYVLIGAILIIGSISSYIIFCNRKKVY